MSLYSIIIDHNHCLSQASLCCILAFDVPCGCRVRVLPAATYGGLVQAPWLAKKAVDSPVGDSDGDDGDGGDGVDRGEARDIAITGLQSPPISRRSQRLLVFDSNVQWGRLPEPMDGMMTMDTAAVSAAPPRSCLTRGRGMRLSRARVHDMLRTCPRGVARVSATRQQ
jgi:hypothetical protein